jgi:hypothetical protein
MNHAEKIFRDFNGSGRGRGSGSTGKKSNKTQI